MFPWLGAAWVAPFEYRVDVAKNTDFQTLSRIHQRCFARVWTVEEIESLAAQASVEVRVARRITRMAAPMVGFAIIRSVVDEAEILTIGVDPAHRRRGIALTLMTEALERLPMQGVRRLLLEVSATNDTALKLYRGLGFREIGRRTDYYRHEADVGGEGELPHASTALVFERDLT